MYAVIFEVKPTSEGKEEYLEIAGKLKEFLKDQPGFISIERFQSMVEEDKVLSLSFWKDESCIEMWRNVIEHRHGQKAGKDRLFESYRIRVAQVARDYTDLERDEAPQDSNQFFDSAEKS